MVVVFERYLHEQEETIKNVCKTNEFISSFAFQKVVCISDHLHFLANTCIHQAYTGMVRDQVRSK